MKISSWNIIGGNDPLNQQQIHDFMWINHVDIMSVLKTRIKERKDTKVIKSKFKAFKVACNYSAHVNGIIWLLWRPNSVDITPLIIPSRSIHYEVLYHATCCKFHLTIVYASNQARSRDDLWTNLLNISQHVNKRILLGDFNIVRDVSEWISNTTPNLADILDFNSCILHCGVDDITSSGCEMTWTNKQEIDTLVWSKLDRALANVAWQLHYPATSIVFLPTGISDHSPIHVTVFEDKHSRPRFNFLNRWVDHPSYHNLVKEAWMEPVQGSLIFKLFSRLKNVKKSLRKLHKENFTQIALRVKARREELHDCTYEVDAGVVNGQSEVKVNQKGDANVNVNGNDKGKKKLRAYVDVNYSPSTGSNSNSWRLKRTVRDAEGTSSSQKPSCGLLKMESSSLPSTSSIVVPSSTETVVPAVTTITPTVSTPVFPTVTVGTASAAVASSVSVMASSVSASMVSASTAASSVSASSTSTATASTSGTVPTPDEDITDLVKPIDMNEIKEAVFSIGSDKSPGPDGFSSAFFKTSWANVGPNYYKAIQAYFKNGRLSKQANATLITLIPKKKIMGCIISSWFSIKINGSVHGFFKGKSGLRQVDPLPLYLFVLSMEVLSRYLRRICVQQNVSFHPKCNKIGLTHLIFADDLMIFTRGDVPSIATVLHTLKKLSDWSGL
ncbi:uncharacterized protein LOC141630370 [Silene latifolia]|uniref:uncharacterized protein LOC141630370 n=1 Tax=Silene latifolia TaxID=37657 RepID=UPI003D770A6F